ncbi:MAG: carbohydrate binding domain-containing protein, partial [Mucilaginibacter polytrichastri]|nr:carbohydrate binding domain-containing protein [Mucilaginibacter polytrichastri]
TCVQVAGASYPKTYRKNSITPLEGKSLVPNFSGKNHNRGSIYWEHEANIALRNGPWKMVAKTAENATFDPKTLELYNLDADPSEMKNLAQKEPARLQTLYADWQKWANRIHVFPLDTRGYGERMEAYRRNINGTFDDNLGGWAIRKNASVKGAIDVDSTAQLSGKNAAKISIGQPGERPNALAMVWNFKAKKGQKYQVELNAKAKQEAQFYFRLEHGNNSQKLFDRQVTAKKTPAKTASPVLEIPADGQYQLALYFGEMKAGSEVWVDDVQLKSISK